ncbi:DUF1638 domain-containing protein [Alloyangia pacifica]|uniref:DUF1638 domain-containing protein n=1 Tax=Alloyangia pacifica TaxID=311180 RepID=A0A1I6PEQ9_9RHOB|nr:DUF1638 domain-containing protein [Alloyangia pacifica]SDG26003.1 Protein of unknown function [Alloyangia pacifica]SFS38653.1 Protein of unknown function [Alloyangia pacifica]
MTRTPDGFATSGPSLPSDIELTTAGLPLAWTVEPNAAERGRILLIACGALAREVLALRAQPSLSHLHLTCLPANLHNHPERIPAAVRTAVEQHRGTYAHIKLLYADCGTGGQLATLCEELGIEMLPGPHCYAFFDGTERFAARAEMTSFYLTDFLVRQFDAFVWRPLGLDRHPELRDAYFGNYRNLVHLAQIDDPDTAQLAKRHAERLGLDFERRVTGYGDLGTAMQGWARSDR